MDSFATGYVHVSDALLKQLAKVWGGPRRDLDGSELSQAVAMVQGIAPRDETEAMLALQMVAVHKAVIGAASRLGDAQGRDQEQTGANALSKLTRTFAAQVDALRNWRLNGTQTIHVYHDRGDAGPVANGEPPGGHTKNKGQPHGPYGSTERRPPLRGEIEAIAAGLPRPGRQRT